MRIHRALSIAAVSLALFGPSIASAQTDEEKAAARALATEGAEAYNAKKYAEAYDLLNRAEAVFHAPTHLLLIGRAQVGLGKLVAARETFLKLLREQLAPGAPSVFKKAQQEAKDELAAIEPRIGSLRISLTGPGATESSKVVVKLDESTVAGALIGVHRPTDPGKHTVTATMQGRDPVTQEVTLGDGEKKEVSLEVQTPGAVVVEPEKGTGAGSTGPDKPTDKNAGGSATMRYVGIGGIALGGVGIVTGAVFTGLWSVRQDEADQAFATCAQPCTPELQQKIKDLDRVAASRGTVAVISLSAGVVLAGGGVALYMLGRPKPKTDKPSAAFVLPYVTPTSAGVVGTF